MSLKTELSMIIYIGISIQKNSQTHVFKQKQTCLHFGVWKFGSEIFADKNDE